MPTNSKRSVHFSERVTVASLPVEEFKDSLAARRGPWGSAPICDELWDGERRLFWERELQPEELKEILRFRKLAKYSLAVQHTLGASFIRVPTPKIPPIIQELVKLGNQQQEKESLHKESIAFPEPPPEDSSPRHIHQQNHSMSSVDTVLFKKDEEEFSFVNPAMQPTTNVDGNAHAARQHGSGVLSASQRESIRSASKVLRNVVVHRGRTKQKRMRKRVKTHAILQPWFAVFYFFIPLMLVGSFHLLPFAVQVFTAWRNQNTIRAAIEVPAVLLKVLPQNAVLQSTVSVGLFVFEVTGIVYLCGLVLSQLAVFMLIRPMVMSLSNSMADRDIEL